MSQLICKNLLVGYEGKAILDHLNFEIHAGDYLCVVGENRCRKKYLDENSARFAAAYFRANRDGRWPAPERDRLSASADHRAEGFSSVGAGNRAVWLPEPLWTPPILQSRGKAACAGCHAQNADRIAGKMLLPGAFRAVSNSASCWRAPSALPGKCCFWTSLFPVLTQK